jgi:hypothetical protein
MPDKPSSTGGELPKARLQLEWGLVESDGKKCPALIFDPATWQIIEMIAAEEGSEAQPMITEAVVSALGKVIYARHRDGEIQ